MVPASTHKRKEKEDYVRDYLENAENMRDERREERRLLLRGNEPRKDEITTFFDAMCLVTKTLKKYQLQIKRKIFEIVIDAEENQQYEESQQVASDSGASLKTGPLSEQIVNESTSSAEEYYHFGKNISML